MELWSCQARFTGLLDTYGQDARKRLVVLHKFALILGDCREWAIIAESRIGAGGRIRAKECRHAGSLGE